MCRDFLDVQSILGYFFYVDLYLGLVVNIHYHFFQIFIQLNGQGLQSSSKQNVLTLVFFTQIFLVFDL